MLHLEEIQEIRAALYDKRRVRLVDVVLGQLSVFLNSFVGSGKKLLNFGRRPSQNPQKLTLAALKFGVGNVKNRRFQLGLVRFLPGFYRNTHREPLNTTTKGFGLEPRRSTGLVFGLKSDSRQYQLVVTSSAKYREQRNIVNCACTSHVCAAFVDPTASGSLQRLRTVRAH